MKIGDKVKVKELAELRKITKIGFKKQVPMKNGCIFGAPMLVYEGQEGIITEIVKPGKANRLVSPSYKIGEVDIYWSPEMLEVIS